MLVWLSIAILLGLLHTVACYAYHTRKEFEALERQCMHDRKRICHILTELQKLEAEIDTKDVAFFKID